MKPKQGRLRAVAGALHATQVLPGVDQRSSPRDATSQGPLTEGGKDAFVNARNLYFTMFIYIYIHFPYVRVSVFPLRLCLTATKAS